jgi:hypothetical protein
VERSRRLDSMVFLKNEPAKSRFPVRRTLEGIAAIALYEDNDGDSQKLCFR